MNRTAFRLDQPLANDLVGNPVLLAGAGGGGFEAEIQARLLDSKGRVAKQQGLGIVGRTTRLWQAKLKLPKSFSSTRGVIEVGPIYGSDEGGTPAFLSVPVFFGTNILPGFMYYKLHVVQSGESLSLIAAQYDSATHGTWQQIFRANRDILAKADRIHPGQVLRIPHK